MVGDQKTDIKFVKREKIKGYLLNEKIYTNLLKKIIYEI